MSRRKRETTFDTFQRLQILGGTVVSVDEFPEARKPSYRISLDFGEPVGVLRSSAQLTRRYAPGDLMGKTLLAVVNFPAKRIAGFASECLVLGLVNPEDPGDVVLIRPDVPGTKGWGLG